MMLGQSQHRQGLTYRLIAVCCFTQVQAGNLTPVTALVQNMIMTALFEPFEALCSAANGEMVEVRGFCMFPDMCQDVAHTIHPRFLVRSCRYDCMLRVGTWCRWCKRALLVRYSQLPWWLSTMSASYQR